MWVDAGYRDEAQFKGYTVVEPSTVITTHLTEVIKDNMAELLSYAETQKLIDELGDDQKKLVADIVPNQITIGGIQRILQNLLKERISIRDLPTILEAVAEGCVHTRNVAVITEHVRARLARQICEAHANGAGFLPIPCPGENASGKIRGEHEPANRLRTGRREDTFGTCPALRCPGT